MLAAGARRQLAMVAFALAVVAILLTASAQTAFASAGTNASCMGHEASSISPPGSSSEFPGGMPDLKRFIDEAFPGTPPGVIMSTIAKLHEGSHEACDAALE